MWRDAFSQLNSACLRLGAWCATTRPAKWATVKLNLLAPDVRSQILIIVQADGNVSIAYDHPRSSDDVVQLIQGIGMSLQIVANRHNVPLALQQQDGTQIPLTGAGLPPAVASR